MITREQILKDIIIDAIKHNVNRCDIIKQCYNILSVYYSSLEESLFDFAIDIVDSIITYYDNDNIGMIMIDLDTKEVEVLVWQILIT